MPVYIAYADVMELLNREEAAEYRREIIGDGVIISAPNEYWEVGMAAKMEMMYTKYLQQPIHDRAKFRAWSFLKNAVEILERHRDTMARKRKAYLDSLAKPKKASSGRRRARR